MKDTARPANPAASKPLRAAFRPRLRAAGIHFSLSLVIFAAALYLILVHWYPGFHFTVDGGWQGVRIMAAVDLVLGPMLTLIVFDPRKARRLIVLDLACIGLVQLGALAWGFYAIHSQQPVAIAYHDGTFYSVTSEPLTVEDYPVARLAELSDRRPALVYAAPATTEVEMSRATAQAILGIVAPWEDPLFFRPFAPHWFLVQAQAIPAREREGQHPAFGAALPAFLAAHGGTSTDYRFFPYTGRYGECTLALTAAGIPVDAVGCERY